MRKKEKEEIRLGEELYSELHSLISKYNEGVYSYGRLSDQVENWIASLSSDEFNNLLSQPIGNISRTHYSAIRRRKLKEKEDVLLVYYGKEDKDKKDELFKYLEENGYKSKMVPPYNNPSCPWVYVHLCKDEYWIGKAGIDLAAKRLIEHSVTIDEFKEIYNIYKKTNTLDDPSINTITKKYKNYSIFCFNFKEEFRHKIKKIKYNIKNLVERKDR